MPQRAFVAIDMLMRVEHRVTRLALTYVLLPSLIFFSVHGVFSFQNGALNTPIGAFAGSFASPEESSSGLLGSRLETVVALAICFLAMLPLYAKISRLCIAMPTMISLPVLAMASALWSQDPSISLRYGFYLLANTLFAFYLFARFTPVQQLRIIMGVGVIVATASALVALLLPQYGIDHQLHEGAWQGIFTQKNVCAEVLVFLMLPALTSPRKEAASGVARFLYVLLLLSVIVMTKSRTGWLTAGATMLFVCMLRYLRRCERRSSVLLIVTAALALVFGAAVLAAEYLPAVLAFLNRDANLSGREQIWRALIVAGVRRPVLGYGFAAFFNGLSGASADVVLATGWFVPSAHNGMLSLWVELGLVGIIFMAMTFLKACRDAITCFGSEQSAYVDWCIGVLFLTLIQNMDERTIMTHQQLLWILYITACTALSVMAKGVRTRGKIARHGTGLTPLYASGQGEAPPDHEISPYLLY